MLKEPQLKHKTKTVRAANLMPKDEHSLSILKERATKLSQHIIEDINSDQAIQYICFSLGNNTYYGITYDYIQEIIMANSITSLPNVPKFIKGTLNRNGLLISVVDLKEFFGLGATNYDSKDGYVIIISKDNLIIGILLDELIDTYEYTATKLSQPIETKNAIKREYLLGLADGKVAIINGDTILQEINRQIIQSSKT